MPRPLWTGTIQISLVSFAVDVYPASNNARPIAFHEMDRRTMGRIHRQNISSGWEPRHSGDSSDKSTKEQQGSARHETSLHLARKAERGPVEEIEEPQPSSENMRVVDKPDIVKGFEYAKGKYAIVEPQELKNLRIAGKRTVELSQFAKLSEIDPVLYEKPYFVFSKKGPQAKAFAVIRETMIESAIVGIGEIVFSGRQHLMAIAAPHDPEQPGMMLYTLRFATELRNPTDYSHNAEHVDPDASQLRLAKQLIDAYMRPFDLNEYKDHYEEALRDLVEAKIYHQAPPEHEPARKPAKVIDLMEALKKSLAQKNLAATGQTSATETAAKKPASATKKSPATRSNKSA